MSTSYLSAGFLDEMYARWKADPGAVEGSWARFFEGFELGLSDGTGEGAAAAGVAAPDADAGRDQSRVASLIFAYRSLGHRMARTDPLGSEPEPLPELEIGYFDLTEGHLEQAFDIGHLALDLPPDAPHRLPLRAIIEHLRATYCGHIGVEYLHLQDVDRRRWIQRAMEPHRNAPRMDRRRKLEILRNLVDATLFETFIGRRYPAQKRFSLEGAESLLPALHAVVEACSGAGIDEVVLGMPHRGRLNVLANILDKSYAQIFCEFEDNVLPSQYGGDGDVKYHKGFSSDHVNQDGHQVHLSLTANPSHLEAVNPVVQGRVRAKQRRRDDTERRRRVLPVLIHGDAAFAGQGLVAETLNLSQLRGYTTGGTLHIIVNNQIGFTTLPVEARSSTYATDVAKMVEAPVFHVNGDDPEAVVYCTELALRFRQMFGCDVVVDMVCYRRHGHNEGDEPAFTQPVLYDAIKSHPPVQKLYTQRLLEEGHLTPELEARITAAFEDEVQRAFEEVKNAKDCPVKFPREAYEGVWEGLDNPWSFDPVPTAVSREVLLAVARALTTVPEGFSLHRKVRRQLGDKLRAVQDGGEVDWAMAEALSFGSLLYEGIPVRLSGQDSQRGTFSHRHAVWQDTRTQEAYIPQNHIADGQARFCVYNSLLSEAAVLGFEYGYALDEPHMLILWEAQFGDFANGAQVIVDQFIVSGQSKWQRSSGLVMLLPHGYEGQGPEHSNAYLERYLLACAEQNIQVCNFTTSAQYFHALRRQVKRPFRRPLVVMAPKSLLRARAAASPVSELCEGGFQEILDDPNPPRACRRVVLCSGKVYYDLREARDAHKGAADETALVRVEQLYPLHQERLCELAARYNGVDDVVWAQEEPQNRGAWAFIEPHLRRAFDRCEVRYAGRAASASPATGSLRRHREGQQRLVAEALNVDIENENGEK